MTNPIGSILGAVKYLPATLTRQALEKVNPKFKNFFAKAVTYGLDANRAIDYLADRFQSDTQKDYQNQLEKGASNNTLRPDEMLSRSQMANQAIPGKIVKGAAALATGGLLGGLGEQEQQEEPQGAANILAEHSPELHQFIEQQIQGGISPIQAATMAYKNPNFTRPIGELEKATRRRLPEIVSSLYPSNAQPSRSPQGQQQSQPQSNGSSQRVQQMQQILQALQGLKSGNG